MAGVNKVTNIDAEKDEGSRTELDSHANMPVLGINCYVIAEVGKAATLQRYRPDYEPMDIPLVNEAVQYDFHILEQHMYLSIEMRYMYQQ